MLLVAAVRTPTACHEVPWRFLMIQKRSALSRILDRVKEMSADQITHLHQSREHDLNMFSQLEFNVFYYAGTLIVICARFYLPFKVA